MPQLTAGEIARGTSSAGLRAALNPAGLMAMQRLAGNKATLHALRRTSVQRVDLLDNPVASTDEDKDDKAAEEAGSSIDETFAPGSAGATAGAPGGTGGKAGETAVAQDGPGLSGLTGIAGEVAVKGEGGRQIDDGLTGIAGEVAVKGEGGRQIDDGLTGIAGEVAVKGEGGRQIDDGLTGIAGEVAVKGEGGRQIDDGLTGIAGEVAVKQAGADQVGGGAGGAGGEGIGGGTAGSEEIPAVADPADIAVTEITQLSEQPPEVATGEVEQPQAPQQEQPANLEAGTGEIERQAQGGGGGIVDTLINTAVSTFRGIAGTISGGVRAAASGIASRVGGFFSRAFSFATNLVTTVTNGLRGIASGIATEIGTHLGALKDGVKGIVTPILNAVRGVMGQVGGAIRGAITAILSGQPVLPTLLAPFRAILGPLFGGITGQITAVINRIKGAVDNAIARVLQTIVSLTQSIINGLTFLANLLTTAATFLQEELTRLTNWVTQVVSGLPDVLRRVITAIVNAVIAAARRIINNLVTRARAYIARVIANITAFVQRAIGLVTRIVTNVRNAVRAALDLVAAGVRTVANALNRVKTWLLGKIAAFVARALRTVLNPIAERLKQRLLALIGPAAAAAMRQAQLLFPNGLPAPREVVQAAEQGAREVASEAGSAILAGLTNPEGDHIGFGIQLAGGASVGGPAGISGTAGAMFDIVLDYRRNDIGFFLSPNTSVAGGLGVGGGAAGGLGVAGAWGTVATFGDESKDVLDAYGGWSTNVSYGVTGGVADVIGAEASTGGSFYRGGGTPGIPVFSYTPLGADEHPVPGTAPVAIPGTTTPGAPDVHGTAPVGEVRFPRQVSDVEAAPGGPAAVDAAAVVVNDLPSGTPPQEAARVDVLGEASRVWDRPRSGRTREQENADLADARARSVASRLRGLIRGTPVTEHGNADLRAAAAGKGVRDASPADQRASMVASTVVRGTPGTTTPGTTIPGTPPTTTPQQHTFGIGSMPNPLQARQTTGWDTTASATFVGGAEAQVGAYGGVGVSYSIPLGKAHMDPETMHMIRIVTGFMKLIGDVETLSPLGFIRDALGLSAAFSERDGVIGEMASAVTDWAIPLPPGAAVA